MSTRKAFKSANTQAHTTAHKPSPSGDTGIIGWRTSPTGQHYPIRAPKGQVTHKIPTSEGLSKKHEALIKTVEGYNKISHRVDEAGTHRLYLYQIDAFDPDKVIRKAKIEGKTNIEAYLQRTADWQKQREENAKEDAAWEKAHGFTRKSRQSELND